MWKQVRIKLKKWDKSFFSGFERISNKNYFTTTYALSRSFLALGTIISLLNSKYIIFPEHILENYAANPLRVLYDFSLFRIVEYQNLLFAQIIAILILIFVIVGIFPQITGILHWWVSYSYFITTALPSGGDQITAILTLFLIPITLMDNRRNHWNISLNTNRYKNFIAFLFLFLIQLQVAIIYLIAAAEKMYKVDFWVNGTAIYYWVNHDIFGAPQWLSFFIDPILDYPFILTILSWSVIIFEILLFGAFFMTTRNKKKLFIFAIIFHFLIISFHGLITFFFAMVGALIIYLYPNDKNIIFDKYRSLIGRNKKIL